MKNSYSLLIFFAITLAGAVFYGPDYFTWIIPRDFNPDEKKPEELERDYMQVMRIGMTAAVFGVLALIVAVFSPGLSLISVILAAVSVIVQNFIPIWAGIFAVWPWTISAIDSKKIFKVWAAWSVVVIILILCVAFLVLNRADHPANNSNDPFERELGIKLP